MNFRIFTVLLFIAGLAVPGSAQHSLPTPYEKDSSYLFSGKIQFQEEVISGYFALKYTNESSFRISAYSPTGAAIADLEWIDAQLITHFLIAKLQNPVIKKKLVKDFELMALLTLVEGRQRDSSHFKKGLKKYVVNLESSRLSSVEEFNFGGRLKRSLSFDYNKKGVLKALNLKHHTFALQLQLSIIE